MTELSKHQILWRLREGGKHDEDFGLALAVLIYLRWADFQEAEQEAIAAFEDTDYEPIIPSSLHWRSWCYLQPDELHDFLTKHLPSSLNNLRNSRQNLLATHLYRVGQSLEVFWRYDPEEVATIVKWLVDQPFETPGDRTKLLQFYDDFLNATTHRWSGEYRTPSGIAHLLAELATPANGERIYDPCFGSAGLLTNAVGYILRKVQERSGHSKAPEIMITGVEQNLNAYVIGLTRLVLAGIDNPHVELGNSLERMPPQNPQRDGFDIVFANPPWGMRADFAGMDHFPVQTKDTTSLFLQHALSQLRPKGRAVIIVPQGLLFRGGPDQRLRRMLLEEHTVEAVIALPETAFMPFTAVRSSILMLRKGGSTDRIRMVDAESFFDKGRGRIPATITAQSSEQLVKALRTSKSSKNCWDIDVESLASIDWDFTPRRRDQSGLIEILDALQAEIEVLPLIQCCRVFLGRSFKREQLLDKPTPREEKPEQMSMFQKKSREAKQALLFDTPHIPYVRIKDIKNGQANKGSSWLSADVANSVDAKWKLKPGDVLLSKSGTIGKLGIVRNGAVGAIAANSLFVLRPDTNRLDPHFLLAYLRSFECRLWLDDHTHAGTTVKHLSKSILEKLLVPIPSLQVQRRVAVYHRDYDDDALVFLSQIMTAGEGDSISEWLNKVIDVLPDDIDTINNPLDLNLLNHLVTEIQSHLRNLTLGHVAEHEIDSPLIEWIIKFNQSLGVLNGIQEIPIGPSLLGIMQDCNRGLQEAERVIKGNLPNDSRARNITNLLSNWLDKACSAMMADVKVVLRTDSDTIAAGQLVELPLFVQNQGSLPLRNLNLTTNPDWGHGKIQYFPENVTKIIHLSGVAPKTTGAFTINVNWSGVALDGHRINGSRETALNVYEPDIQPSDVQSDIGGSPYVCGDPVRPERKDVFFGRDELLDQIRRQIVHSGNVVLLEGNRRSGKSSILWHLEGPKAVPGWMGIYSSLQGAEGSRDGIGVPTVEVFREMAKSIAASLRTLPGETPLPDGTILPPSKKLGIAKACRQGIRNESPFSDFREYSEVALEKLAEHDMGLLMMMDEFDKLQEGIDSGVTSPQVPENIRFLVQTYPRFSAILTGSRRLKRMREEYWSVLFGLGTRFGVSSLPADAARLLITEPVKGKLTYSREAVERAFFLTSGQPYLLQCLCNRVFDMAVQLKTRSVAFDLVNQAGNALVEDNEHFASLWDYAGSDRRRLILFLCHKEFENPDLLRLGVIKEKLGSHGIEVDDETLIIDLEFLRDLELVDKEDDSSGAYYILTIPLMGAWMEKQQDFAAIRIKARLETEDQHG